MEKLFNSKDRDILELIYRVTHKCVIFCEEQFKKYGLTFPQSAILFLIMRSDKKELCQKDFEEVFGVKGSSISSIINNMCKKELIERKPCVNDGRKLIINLTDKGKEIINYIKNDSNNLSFDLFKNLTDYEKDEFIKILLKLD